MGDRALAVNASTVALTVELAEDLEVAAVSHPGVEATADGLRLTPMSVAVLTERAEA